MKAKFLKCHVCKETKPRRDFYDSRLVGRKNHARCIPCEKLRRNKYWSKNQVAILARGRQSFIRSPESRKYSSIKDSAKRRGWPFLITKDEFVRWWRLQEQICSYCGVIDLSIEQQFHINKITHHFTIDRINNALPYTIENITLACWSCNSHKGSIFSHDEWREIAQKYIKPKWMAKLNAAN